MTPKTWQVGRSAGNFEHCTFFQTPVSTCIQTPLVRRDQVMLGHTLLISFVCDVWPFSLEFGERSTVMSSEVARQVTWRIAKPFPSRRQPAASPNVKVKAKPKGKKGKKGKGTANTPTPGTAPYTCPVKEDGKEARAWVCSTIIEAMADYPLTDAEKQEIGISSSDNVEVTMIVCLLQRSLTCRK